MNDRLKFRVWDKAQNKYLTLNSKSDTIDSWISFDNTGVYLVERHNDSDVTFFTDITDDVVVQFCTGLKDKNGTLIYEGDIVKDWNNKIYKIVWSDDAACFLVENIETNSKMGIYDLICDENNLEVIGNIYESEIPYGRSETSPDSEQMEQTGAKPRQRHSVSVEEFQDNEELLQ